MKEKMKFIPYSNGFYKIRHKKIIKPGNIFKKIIFTIIFILLSGVIYQYISDKVELEDLSTKNKYVKIDNKKYYFKSIGDKKPTIILDSNIGFGLDQWTKIQNQIKDIYGLRTFAYDRAGYGFSEFGKQRNPEEQARLLRMILKKLGLNGPFILLGEEYGSLVMCSFAKAYPELVQGVVLINPINEEALDNKDYMKQFDKEIIPRYIEKVGSYFGLNELLFKLGFFNNSDSLSEHMNTEELKTYNIFRTRKNYTSAYYSELKNITSMTSKSQSKDMFNNLPFVIVVNNNEYKAEQENLSSLGNEKLTKIINENSNTDSTISMENNDSILDAIKFIVDNLPKEN